LSTRTHDVGAGQGHGARTSVVADGEVLPVRDQRRRSGPEQLAVVGGVVYGCVEVDVSADLHEQVQQYLVHRMHARVGHVTGDELGDPLTHLHPSPVALGHERVQRRLGEHVVAERHGEVDDGVPHTHSHAGGGARCGEDTVVQVVHPEQRTVGDLDGGHTV